jgi:hypothetical protein
MRTPIGLVEATSVDQVTLESITEADARRAGAGSRRDLLLQLAGDPGRPVFRIGLHPPSRCDLALGIGRLVERRG